MVFATVRHKLPVNTSLMKMKQNHVRQYMIKRWPMLTHEQAAILMSAKLKCEVNCGFRILERYIW